MCGKYKRVRDQAQAEILPLIAENGNDSMSVPISVVTWNGMMEWWNTEQIPFGGTRSVASGHAPPSPRPRPAFAKATAGQAKRVPPEAVYLIIPTFPYSSISGEVIDKPFVS